MKIRVWPFRRLVQISVILVTLSMPVLARYGHYLSARDLDDFRDQWKGSLQGELLQGADAAIRIGIPDGEGGVEERRPRKAILDRVHGFTGSPWAAHVFGIPLTDPLAVAESALASKSVQWVLISGLLIPLAVTLALGRVFCGWICPMGFFFDMADKVRSALDRVLEIKTFNVRISPYGKYVVLGIGLIFTLAFSLPILHYIYPPALFGAEAHGLVNGLFDRAEQGRLGFAWIGLTSASLFLLGLLLIEIFIAPRFFCRSVCPGGALYSLLGRYRLVRIRRESAGCTHCTLCDKYCPRGLLPMVDRIGGECDNCGVCIDVCQPGVLKYHISMTDRPITPAGSGPATPDVKRSTPTHPDESEGSAKDPDDTNSSRKLTGAAATLLFALLALAGADSAQAHHVLGVPHYAYDEDYPQAPVMKLRQDVGPWEVQLTQYPGHPVPGERAQVHAYMVNRATGQLFDGELSIVVRQQHMTGRKQDIYGPSVSVLEENVYKFFFTYPEEGNYEITLGYEDDEGPSTLSWPVAIGEPGSPWATLGMFGGGAVFLLLVLRAIRIKRARVQSRRLEPSPS